jgi:hypothetical protein
LEAAEAIFRALVEFASAVCAVDSARFERITAYEALPVAVDASAAAFWERVAAKSADAFAVFAIAIALSALATALAATAVVAFAVVTALLAFVFAVAAEAVAMDAAVPAAFAADTAPATWEAAVFAVFTAVFAEVTAADAFAFAVFAVATAADAFEEAVFAVEIAAWLFARAAVAFAIAPGIAATVDCMAVERESVVTIPFFRAPSSRCTSSEREISVFTLSTIWLNSASKSTGSYDWPITAFDVNDVSLTRFAGTALMAIYCGALQRNVKSFKQKAVACYHTDNGFADTRTTHRNWWWGKESNLRPSAYETDELPLLHPTIEAVSPAVTPVRAAFPALVYLASAALRPLSVSHHWFDRFAKNHQSAAGVAFAPLNQLYLWSRWCRLLAFYAI